MSVADTNHVQMWPSNIAHHVTECIFRDVQEVVRTSRLNRNLTALIEHRELKHIRNLGQGAFSQVRLVNYKSRAFAMKHLRQDLLNRPSEFRQAASELAVEGHMLASLSHPNLIKLHGWAANGVASFAQGYHDSFFLLLDPLEETLEDRIETWKQIRQFGTVAQRQEMYTQQRRACEQIASVLSYLHDNGIIYRDLKPSNLGFCRKQIKLYDLGLSRELPYLDTRQPFQMSGRVGTQRYMAPEVACHEAYNVSADVYSWAMVCYEILTLERPYDRFSREMHDALVCRQGVRPEWPPMGREYWLLQTIITSAWNQIPHLRPCMANICHQLSQEHTRAYLQLRAGSKTIISADEFSYRKAPMRSISDSTDITVMSTESGLYSVF
ncbi:hypothetical protein FisN_4Hh090 [Fistulifera solaris]|uniref:Protein kinase domain-containing protein n=1 Tax=Fistulifera solaris TaxID=1519565 RepID=A0A1Z5KER2_FISSO|nr:hypothetical protein FisN_4Hh090 [Fistulifera solaris]|eukprot:GAX24571.1 hypothetical protein FisN_4Hh090 [Fistulifera solaris]